MQDLIRKPPGVVSTRVGYTGGEVRTRPTATTRGTRRRSRSPSTPTQTSYRDLLEFFFQIHDPTTLNRQGNDIGTSYRSAIFYTDDEQHRVAEDTIADVEASGLWPGKVVTEVRAGRRRSGRPSPSTRTTWSATPMATPAISCGRTGFWSGRHRLPPARRERP